VTLQHGAGPPLLRVVTPRRRCRRPSRRPVPLAYHPCVACLKRLNSCSTTSAPARAVPSPGDRTRPAPVLPAGDLPRQKISSSEPTYAAYKRPAPLLAAPHPSRKLPVAPNCTATPPFAPPPSTSTVGRPLPRRHPLKPSPTKVSTGVGSPHPPSSFSPCPRPSSAPGCRRPPPDRGRPCLPPLFWIGGGRRALLPKAPVFPFYPEPLSNLIHSLSLLLQNSP
jgi:hypothetical protein